MNARIHALPLVALLTCGYADAQVGRGDDSMSLSLDEVVVTGSNRAVSRDLTPYTVSVIDRAQLRSTGQTQVLSAVSGQVPSLFVTQRGLIGFGVSNGGAGHIKMRGVGGDRASGVLMMVDGQPQFAGIYSHHVADFYDAERVERVEVLRGPGSVLYGSNAMAGVINVITRDAQSDGVSTTLSTQYGSYDTWLSSVTNTVRSGRFSSLVSLSYDRTDGVNDDVKFRQGGGYAKLGYELSRRWRVGADFTLTNFKSRDAVYPKLSDPQSTDVYRQSVTRGETAVTLTNNYGRTDGSAMVYYSYGNHVIDDPRHFRSNDNRLGALLFQNFHPWTGADMTAGFDFNTYSGKIPVSGGRLHTEGSKTTMSRKRITEYSPYLTLSQSLAGELLVLNAGVRMSNSDMFDTQWIPQGGVSVNPGRGYNLKASLSKGYRNPSFRELYLYAMANPDLEPESMMNYEVSVSKRFDRRFIASLTAYYCKGDNMIQVLDMKNRNTGRFINKGIEVSVQSRPCDALSLSASYSYLHTSLRDLTGAPRHQYYIGADWHVTSSVDLGVDLKGVSRLFVHESIKDQSYAVVNLKATYRVCRYASLFVRLENLTDASYVINRGYDMPGLSALGGVRISIN